MMFSRNKDHLMNTLGYYLEGTVRADPETIAEASVDFGRVVIRKPQAVVWPASVDDVVAVVRYARQMGWTVSVRGAGHSQGGQSLNREGIVIDTRHLNRIEKLNAEEGWVIAGAGMRWGALVRKVAERGLLPPVLTDNLAVTIGGTLSVGGVGPASFRRGLQAHHCLGVEVVLASGELVWLTPESEPELFNHILCGLGQFGIITKAKLSLRSFQPYTQTVRLTYRNLEAFLNAALILMKRNQPHYLEGFAYPEAETIRQDRCPRHRYVLEMSREVDKSANVDDRELIQDLNNEGRRMVTNWETLDYVFRLEKAFEGYKRPVEKGRARPWVEHFMPISAVNRYVKAVAPHFPSTTFLLWPMQVEYLRFPMFALPQTTFVVLVGIMASLPPSRVTETLPILQHASEMGVAFGGKRYLSGWVDFDQEQWGQHYGLTRWQRITELKQRCDPDRIIQALPLSARTVHRGCRGTRHTDVSYGVKSV